MGNQPMRADEIRAIATEGGDFHVKIPLFLREIAAQLAEANAGAAEKREDLAKMNKAIEDFFGLLTHVAGTIGIGTSSIGNMGES